MPLDYNKTLNLPSTDFSMRASLPAKEPEMLKKWYEDWYAPNNAILVIVGDIDTKQTLHQVKQ